MQVNNNQSLIDRARTHLPSQPSPGRGVGDAGELAGQLDAVYGTSHPNQHLSLRDVREAVSQAAQDLQQEAHRLGHSHENWKNLTQAMGLVAVAGVAASAVPALAAVGVAAAGVGVLGGAIAAVKSRFSGMHIENDLTQADRANQAVAQYDGWLQAGP